MNWGISTYVWVQHWPLKGGYVGPLLSLQRWCGVESLSEGPGFALCPSPPPAPAHPILSAVIMITQINPMPFRIIEVYTPSLRPQLCIVLLCIVYINLPLTFIWGTDSPVSMASSTMQRPLSSSTSHGTKLSWGERPVKQKIHISNTHWKSPSDVCNEKS